jgi:hypothetical protein
VRPGTISGGAPPVAEVPPDVAAVVPEPKTVHVPQEDLSTTIRALEGGGPEELLEEEALDEIDGWRLYLQGTGDPELQHVAEDLGRLGACCAPATRNRPRWGGPSAPSASGSRR